MSAQHAYSALRLTYMNNTWKMCLTCGGTLAVYVATYECLDGVFSICTYGHLNGVFSICTYERLDGVFSICTYVL